MAYDVSQHWGRLPRGKNVAPNGRIKISRSEDQASDQFGSLQRERNCH
jgi:hypothetical protein